VRVTHPRIHRALLRGVRWAGESLGFIVQIGHFRGQIDVEDTAWFVTAYDPEQGTIDLTDGSSEPLEAASLGFDADGVLRCRVKGRFPARFTHAGQAHLLDALEVREDVAYLRAGSDWVPAPGLAPPA
jgi:hypothetical protein